MIYNVHVSTERKTVNIDIVIVSVGWTKQNYRDLENSLLFTRTWIPITRNREWNIVFLVARNEQVPKEVQYVDEEEGEEQKKSNEFVLISRLSLQNDYISITTYFKLNFR